MQLESFNDPATLNQATAAGFASVEVYLQSLIDKDAERLAILDGIQAVKEGRTRPFSDFDREFREQNGLAPRG